TDGATDATGGHTATDTETFTATNVAPTATLTGPPVTVPGQAVSFTLGATDPSTVDTDAGFTFKINWGDGTADQTVTGKSGIVVTHTFMTTGTNTVTLTATDKDNGTSLPVTQTVGVQTGALTDDTLNPGHKLLAVGGTAGDDTIKLIPGGAGKIRVQVNGESQGAFGPAGRIAVFGLAGNDDIHLAGSIRIPAWLDGGDGN